MRCAATLAALTGWLVLLQGDGLNAEVSGLKVIEGDTVHRGDEKRKFITPVATPSGAWAN